MQFLPGMDLRTTLLSPGITDSVDGFSNTADVLDFTALVSAAGLTTNASTHALVGYVTVVDQGQNAFVQFDPTGHAGGTTVAVLQGLGRTVTDSSLLLTHGL